MVKRIGRRFVSLLLTFVTVLTMLPAMTLPALAKTSGTVAGLAVENIELSFTGDADVKWSASGTQIVGAATSTPGDCDSSTTYESTLTITNKGTTTARLSFGYAIEQNSGTIQVGETKVTANGTFTKELAPDGTATVYIKSGSTTAATKITMTDVKLEASATATVTFRPAENGTYKVGGTLITEEHSNAQSSMTPYQVEATPKEGYQFLGWYDATNGIYLKGGANSSIYVSSGTSEVTAIFGLIGTTFQVGTSALIWDDLNNAIISASNNDSGQITLLKSCNISSEYTIPSGVTLLIPFDEDKTCYTSTPTAITSTPTAKPFRTLTMAAGSSLTLASGAAISVGGQYYAASGGASGKMVGPYGYIKMESGSAIDVQSGASLYAWGFISGSGSVTVQSGGTVYEWYQILDFRGGTASIKIKNKVFPFNQYAVQNIEVPMTLYAGASETAYSAIYALNDIYPTSIPFIGTGSKGLFRLTSGSLTKSYDGATDRMIYTIDGVAELSNLSLDLSLATIDSKDYVLPLTNNMTVNLTQGSNLTLNQTAALLPGVEVSIAKGAELTVPSEKSMFIYDVDEWGKYFSGGDSNSRFIPVVNAPGRNGKRAPLEDVKVDVNGKLTAIGSIYTTNSGANICSSEGTGKYLQQGAPGTETATYQYDGGTKRHDIPITLAQLHNRDNSYTPTAGSNAGDTFTYCTGSECGGGKWVKNLQVAAIIDSTGKQTPYPTLQEAVDAYTPDDNTAPKNYIKLLHSTTEEITAKNDLYLDLNGCTVTGNFTMNSNTLYGMDSSAGTGYVTAPRGKIVGGVSYYAKTYETPPTENKEYDRYVAILGAENGTPTLSFHHFNISVSGYRFELAAPQCALFFIGKFQGDEAAKNHLKSLGFTLTDIDNKTTNPRYEIPAGKDIPPMPAKGEASDSEVVYDGEGAFLFEACLMHDIDKENYQTQFSAIAHATFKNSGNSEDNSLSSDERKLSFQEAGKDALDSDPGMNQKDREILTKFLDDLNNSNP